MRHAICHLPVLLLVLVVPASFAAEQGKPRLPAEAFLPNAKFLPPVFSPDGRRIALALPEGEALVVAIRTVEDATIRPVGRIAEPNLQPRWLRWADPTRVLLGAEIGTPGGPVRTHRVFAFETDPGATRPAGEAAPPGVQEEWDLPVQDEVIHWQRDDPLHALIQYRDPGQLYPSVKLMDVGSGGVTSVLPSRPGVQLWYADHDGVIRAGAGYAGNRYVLLARIDAKAEFEKIQDSDVLSESGFQFAGFGFDPATLYVWKLLQGRRAVYEYNLTSKHIVQLVFARPDVDIEGIVFNEGRRKLIAIDYIVDEPQRQFLDAEARREQEATDEVLPGTFNQVVSQSRDHRRVIVRATSDTHPPAYYLLVRAGHFTRVDLLLSLYPALAEAHLVPMRAVSYRARDGLEIPAYLTIPEGTEPRNIPVIVRPHGGPMTRDYRQFDPEVQFLASRGFAVFQMNFRGSSGYGEGFRRSGSHQWGQAMQDDITDGVEWLIAQGIADPNRVGIYGASYGGYAALMALIRTPELYRAGASYAGVTSLPLFVADNRRMFSDYDRSRNGGGWGDTKQLQANSPIDHVESIRVPVLLAHGEGDQRVPIKHSERMAKALREAGKDVDYLEFPYERHGFLHNDNQRLFYERLAAFFEKHLTPRAAAAIGSH
jgi:dipeptidyl aminopeptidase/acylaminoacyl peptidase